MENLFIELIKNPTRIFTGSQSHYERPVNRSYNGVEISPEDEMELRKIVQSEVSNRGPKEIDLETDVLFNTAVNRVKAYREKGQDVKLVDVFRMPNQYQGYNTPLYKAYGTATTTLDKARQKKVDDSVNRVISQINDGTYKDVTNGAFYYQHKGDKIYYDDRKPLFKSNQKKPLFVNQTQ